MSSYSSEADATDETHNIQLMAASIPLHCMTLLACRGDVIPHNSCTPVEIQKPYKYEKF